MTSWVMLSRASPRNPFRSPARIQRDELGCPDVGDAPGGGDELAGERLDPLCQGRAPGEASAVVGGVTELELERRPEVMQEAQSRAIRLSFTLVPGVQNDLEAGIDALGVRGQEIPKPASDFRVRSA